MRRGSIRVHPTQELLDEVGGLVRWCAGKVYAMQLIYITCVSGVVYDVIHDVPFVGSDAKGEAVIFAGGVQNFTNIEP